MNFFKKKPVIRFKSFVGNFSIATPVTLARDFRTAWMKKQTVKELKFQRCPGMVDYYSAGYLITAHCDIHIKANKAGVSVIPDINALGLTQQESDMLGAKPFDYRLVDGLAPIQDDVFKWAGKIPLPWMGMTEPGWSGYCMPALMHSDFFDKIFVYPGTVDYDSFHTINFVFSPIKPCEFTIPAGTPLLQVIPYKRESVILAECGKATVEERDKHYFNIPSRLSNYYRKYLASRKIYKLECPYPHREIK